MLVGNTGVGKSSVGCRLLGCKPFGNNHIQRPFEVAATSESVTTNLQAHAGSWLGEVVHGFPVTIVDTPGIVLYCQRILHFQLMCIPSHKHSCMRVLLSSLQLHVCLRF